MFDFLAHPELGRCVELRLFWVSERQQPLHSKHLQPGVPKGQMYLLGSGYFDRVLISLAKAFSVNSLYQ